MPAKNITREEFDLTGEAKTCARCNRDCHAYGDRLEADNKVLVAEHQEALGHLHDAEVKLARLIW